MGDKERCVWCRLGWWVEPKIKPCSCNFRYRPERKAPEHYRAGEPHCSLCGHMVEFMGECSEACMQWMRDDLNKRLKSGEFEYLRVVEG